MTQISITEGRFRLSDSHTLFIPSLKIEQRQSWAFVGANGSGKSALAKALSSELTLLNGSYHNDFSKVVRLSFEQLQKLVNEEWQRNNTDLLSDDEDDTGRTTQQMIMQDSVETAETLAKCHSFARQFGIEQLLSRRFKYLSTGETRKTLLCQVLLSEPDLLILDEPFDGLDAESRQQLAHLLSQLNDTGITLVLVLNRFNEIPDFISHLGVLADCHLTEVGEKNHILAEALVAQLAHAENVNNADLPEPDSVDNRPNLPNDQPCVILRNGYIHYNDRPIIDGLNWQVDAGQHWQIVGPNGAGKSTLLSLITGDHPQGYSNDLTLFGRRRGSGETIWQIKQHIGYVSSSLHLDYRVNISVRNVILSGYFDSIGIYQAASDRQQHLTQQWLKLLGLENAADYPFHSLSWGQQRLTLIARALVKHPTLLILDEPLQGLDPLNRQIIRSWIDLLIKRGQTQLLFVSHHAEDAPECITHRLTFIPEKQGYRYQTEVI
jgi:molybdate transport system ATP-binding protein